MTEPVELEFKKVTAMVVDDHAPIRKAIVKILGGMGIENIVECSDGQEALTELNRKAFSLLITDLYMRKLDGFDLIAAVRGRAFGDDIPIVVVTGEASREDIIRASHLGANEYLLKPFQTQDLEEKCRQVLQSYLAPHPALKAIRSGEALLMGGDPKAARTFFDQAVEIEPNSARARYALGVCLLQLGEVAHGTQMLKRNIERHPKFYRNFAALANWYLKQRNPSIAIQMLESELTLHPKQPERQTLLGTLYLKLNQSDNAIQHFREALKVDNRFYKALMGMGKAFLADNNIDKAIYYYKRVRRYYRTDTQALRLCVKILVDRGLNRKAELFLRDEIQANPRAPDSYLMLGRLYLSSNREEDAEALLTKLAPPLSDAKEILQLRGELLLKQKKFKESLPIFQELVKSDQSSETLASVGEALLGSGKSASALKYLLKAAQLAPRNLRIFAAMGDVFLQTNQYGKAASIYIRALRGGTEDHRKEIQRKLDQTLQKLRHRRSQVKTLAS